MNLTAKQTRMQEQILLRLYPWKTLEEAMKWMIEYYYPITLSRVLYVLGDISAKNYLTSYEMTNRARIQTEYDDEFYRKELRENMVDCTLFDQDQETQDAIALLLWWKEWND